MRVLIIGSGGREHALSWKVARSGKAEKIYCAPGNGGTAQEGENIPLKDSDVAGLVSFAKGNVIDFVIPGPELPLTLGVVDAMTQAGIRCFGPSQWCAQLEGSKAFAKDIMQKAGVPTAACGVFTELEAAKSFVEEKGAPIVIKADGLAAGKGVVVAQTKEEALEALDQIMGGVFGAAGSRVVIEEFLVGEEVSLLAFCDGKTALPLPSAQDHKAVFDGDTGPNTGGMGAYSPAPIVPDAELEKMADIAIRPILAEMARQGHPFTGILYAGLMMTKDGPKVLEYNVRFGDPECEPLLMRLESVVAGVLRRENGPPAAFRAGPQGRFRRRHRPQYRGYGRLQPGPDCARCGARKDGRHRHPPDPRRNGPAGTSFHRYPLCRPDDDQRRPESFGIQRPFRRPGM